MLLSTIQTLGEGENDGEKKKDSLPHNANFKLPLKKPFENFVGKGENAGNQHFLLFLQCFLPFSEQISVLQSHLFCRQQMLSIWTSLKICHLVKS